jgi:hypothetical protein
MVMEPADDEGGASLCLVLGPNGSTGDRPTKTVALEFERDESF